MNKVGIAGIGAIGSIVAKAIQSGSLKGHTLHAVSDIKDHNNFNVQNLSFKNMAEQCDILIEALPPDIVPRFLDAALPQGKTIILISSAALLRHPEAINSIRASNSTVFMPSGAIAGMDGIKALKEGGIDSISIATIKKPSGYENAPYVIENDIDLTRIDTKTKLFEGTALEATQGFPANVNVAATLSLAGLGPEKTIVEIWADPNITGNTHEVIAKGRYSTISSRIENVPDPANPKSSTLAALSIIATLRTLQESLKVV